MGPGEYDAWGPVDGQPERPARSKISMGRLGPVS